MNFSYITDVIVKHCQNLLINGKPLHPMNLLVLLIEILQRKHKLYSIGSFLDGSVSNTSSVFKEIHNDMEVIGKKDEPSSLLMAVDLALESEWIFCNSDSNMDFYAHRIKMVNVLRSIIKDIVNQTETSALENTLNVEELLKDKDDDLNDDN